jgi:acyl-coenzyme A synthetase/AMP-(fatty) acid ligase
VKPGHVVSAEDVRSHCRQQIAGYKVPRTVDFVDNLPKTPSDKISKKDLRAPYWGAEPGRTAGMDSLVQSTGNAGG